MEAGPDRCTREGSCDNLVHNAPIAQLGECRRHDDALRHRQPTGTPGMEAGPDRCTREGSCDNLVHNAPIAQLDRVAASEAVGRGFESLWARHLPLRLLSSQQPSLVRGSCPRVPARASSSHPLPGGNGRAQRRTPLGAPSSPSFTFIAATFPGAGLLPAHSAIARALRYLGQGKPTRLVVGHLCEMPSSRRRGVEMASHRDALQDRASGGASLASFCCRASLRDAVIKASRCWDGISWRGPTGPEPSSGAGLASFCCRASLRDAVIKASRCRDGISQRCPTEPETIIAAPYSADPPRPRR